MQQGAHENNCKEKPLKIKDRVRAGRHVIPSESLADFDFEVKLTVCCNVLSICILPASTGLSQCCIFSVCKCWSHRNSILYCLLYKQHRISLLFVLYLNGPTTVTVKHHFSVSDQKTPFGCLLVWSPSFPQTLMVAWNFKLQVSAYVTDFSYISDAGKEMEWLDGHCVYCVCVQACCYCNVSGAEVNVKAITEGM